MARPRVLLLTNVPAPYRLPVFEALADSVELTVCFCQARDATRRWSPALQSDRVRYRTLAARTVMAPGGLELVWNPGLAAELAQAPYDVYIAGENVTNAPAVLALWRAARRKRRPFVLWSGAIDSALASGNRLSNSYRRWLYRRSDAFIAYGERARQFLLRRGAPPERIVMGLQVVPADQTPPPAQNKAALGLAGRTVLLYVGYFVARKGLGPLVAAFGEVAGPEAVLALVGSGPEEAALRQASRGDARILFPGYLEGRAKSSWYAAADIFALPTLHDPWGLAVNEAMAFGLPVVVSDAAGCVPDIVRDGENGLVWRVGDGAGLRAALARLLGDAALRRRMGQRSRELIAGYTTAAAAGRFLQAIERVLGEPR